METVDSIALSLSEEMKELSTNLRIPGHEKKYLFQQKMPSRGILRIQAV
jgi:hypothetical protein